MLSLSSRPIFHNEDTGKGVVSVQSSRCWYRVALREDEVVIVGPGVEEIYSLEDLPQGLSFEGKALCAVLLFEEQEL